MMTIRLFLSFLVILSTFHRTIGGEHEEDVMLPEVTLSNGRNFPLVGIGVGNLPHDLIGHIVSHALSSGDGYRLIDTAKASNNEELVARAIEEGMRNADSNDNNVVHVVTKVWYTHLGYQRTVLSVKESLKNLKLPSSSVDVRVHILLHWPRCYNEIEWMDCEGEELKLPKYVRDAGPPPHLDPDHAWQESWRALEDMYENDEYAIESIGVSNFHTEDMVTLLGMCRIKPHIEQENVWSFVNDRELVQLLRENNIHFQAYNVVNGLLSNARRVPNALNLLTRIGHSLVPRGEEPFNELQVLISWLIQQGVSVIPRSSSLEHQEENSPRVLIEVPGLEEEDLHMIGHAAWSLLSGEDMRASATFVNKHPEQHINLFWSHFETGEEIPVKKMLKPGEGYETVTHPGHVFVAYNEDKSIRREYRVEADYGQHEEFNLEL